ncbi:c-type cytochrome domain-containing protein [Lewinella sp. W8]|uniref:c-type cytochrome domain-containing protein n=1 Tax=Lewinella sp. W8 TaxID=2528208 RepID=UPI001068C743|nr:c-type cytochrome domain-containing protein [Lewinella sp. W8]MTB49991.1 hypothetical protein [Lewinella sp. W8]
MSNMPTVLLADFGLFLGRFHPLLVHLPIGILLLAVVLEWWPGDRMRPAIRLSWAAGAASAVAAAFCGWLLAGEAGGGDGLFWHKWLGITVAVMAIAGVWITRSGGKLARYFGIATVLVLALAGHQGGNLTHGEQYLWQHAPAPIQQLAGYAPDSTLLRDWDRVNTDSINVYATFLAPVINDKCVRCHNANKQNGGLRMDAPHLLFAGGDGGSILRPGVPLESEWLRRLTLPRDNEKAMPPDDTPVDFTITRLLEYWIAEGADTLAVLDPVNTPEDLKALLLRDYQLDLRPKLFVETVFAPAVNAQILDSLRAMHWSISELLPGQYVYEVKPQPGRQPTAEALAALAELLPEQVVYLSVERLPFQDDDLAPLTAFQNLHRLRLNNTQVSQRTVERLGSLAHLASLNLYGTPVDDGIFTSLDQYPALEKLYLWQTAVSDTAATQFANRHPSVEVDTGFRFQSDATTNSK